jgi:hypothetical protein
VTLHAILDCAHAFFDHYKEDRDVWLMVRAACEDLLGTEDFRRYQELSQTDGFDYNVEENRLIEWEAILKKFDPDNKDIGLSNHEGEIYRPDASENDSKVMKEKVIAYHQLKAFSLFLEDKLALTAGYQEFLVSIYIIFL